MRKKAGGASTSRYRLRREARDKKAENGHGVHHRFKMRNVPQGGHPWWAYVYDEYYDCVICPEYKDLYATRKVTIERVFADAKEKHTIRYTLNLKKLAK